MEISRNVQLYWWDMGERIDNMGSNLTQQKTYEKYYTKDKKSKKSQEVMKISLKVKENILVCGLLIFSLVIGIAPVQVQAIGVQQGLDDLSRKAGKSY